MSTASSIGRGRIDTRYGVLDVIVRHLGERGICVLIDGRHVGTCEWEGTGVGNVVDAPEETDWLRIAAGIVYGWEIPQRVKLSDLDAETWRRVDEIVGNIVGGEG